MKDKKSYNFLYQTDRGGLHTCSQKIFKRTQFHLKTRSNGTNFTVNLREDIKTPKPVSKSPSHLTLVTPQKIIFYVNFHFQINIIFFLILSKALYRLLSSNIFMDCICCTVVCYMYETKVFRSDSDIILIYFPNLLFFL